MIRVDVETSQRGAGTHRQLQERLLLLQRQFGPLSLVSELRSSAATINGAGITVDEHKDLFEADTQMLTFAEGLSGYFPFDSRNGDK